MKQILVLLSLEVEITNQFGNSTSSKSQCHQVRFHPPVLVHILQFELKNSLRRNARKNICHMRPSSLGKTILHFLVNATQPLEWNSLVDSFWFIRSWKRRLQGRWPTKWDTAQQWEWSFIFQHVHKEMRCSTHKQILAIYCRHSKADTIKSHAMNISLMCTDCYLRLSAYQWQNGGERHCGELKWSLHSWNVHRDEYKINWNCINFNQRHGTETYQTQW